MKRKNEPVGDVACPFVGCGNKHPVYQYAARNESRDLQRFAGKFYGQCPTNGKFETQEHILEHIEWRPKSTGALPEKPAEKPAPQPAISTQQNSSTSPVKPPVPDQKTPPRYHLWD